MIRLTGLSTVPRNQPRLRPPIISHASRAPPLCNSCAPECLCQLIKRRRIKRNQGRCRSPSAEPTNTCFSSVVSVYDHSLRLRSAAVSVTIDSLCTTPIVTLPELRKQVGRRRNELCKFSKPRFRVCKDSVPRPAWQCISQSHQPFKLRCTLLRQLNITAA